MQQEVPIGDTLFGAGVLAVFLVFVFLFGWVLVSFKNRRFTRAWGPLVPLIGGKVVADGGGGASSWLTGTYRGRRVRAGMVPQRNQVSGESGLRYNYFEVVLLDVPGGQDWKVEYQQGLWGLQQAGWKVTADEALKARLEAAGVVAEVSAFGGPAVSYKAREKMLLYSEDVTPRWVPAPERFQQEMDLLLRLAEVNAEQNPA